MMGSQIQKERWVAMGAYVLFFLPLVVCRWSRYGRFHSNQGLVLLAFYLLVSLIAHIVPVVGRYILLPLANVFWILWALLGMYYAYQGKMKRLPIIGKFDMLK